MIYEPIWVAMWDGDGKLLLLAVKSLPRHAGAISAILQMLRAVEYGADRTRPLPVLAALTSPN